MPAYKDGPMNIKQKSVLFVATGCYVGNIPVAPGTFGSMLGLPLVFLLSKTDWRVAIFLTLLFTLLSIKIAHAAANLLASEDPGCIVIDEIVGIAVTFIGLPVNMVYLVFGFVFFRVFDILKPYPIRAIEKKLPGGMGIVMDDVAAGIYSNVLLRASAFIIFSNSY